MTDQLLLLGMPPTRDRLVSPDGQSSWGNLVTMGKPATNPTVVYDFSVRNPTFPQADGSFDEVHAYGSLEQSGAQGDAVALFRLFGEVWRVLRHNGVLCAVIDVTLDDPFTTRLITERTLSFLSRDRAEEMKPPDGQLIYRDRVDGGLLYRPERRQRMRTGYGADFRSRVITRQGDTLVCVLVARKTP